MIDELTRHFRFQPCPVAWRRSEDALKKRAAAEALMSGNSTLM
jgi:hypothetical protein